MSEVVEEKVLEQTPDEIFDEFLNEFIPTEESVRSIVSENTEVYKTLSKSVLNMYARLAVDDEAMAQKICERLRSVLISVIDSKLNENNDKIRAFARKYRRAVVGPDAAKKDGDADGEDDDDSPPKLTRSYSDFAKGFLSSFI